MLLENQEIIIDGKLSFNKNVSFSIFKCDEKDRYSFIHLTNGNEYVETSFNDFETLKLLQALNNNDIEALNKISTKAAQGLKAFNSFTYLNDEIINRIAEILNICLSNHEKELYNQDFMNTKDDLYTFSNKTFYNNWFYCLTQIQAFNEETTAEEMIKAIVQYYMAIFVECAIECQSNVAEFYK